MSEVVVQLHKCVAKGEFDFEALRKLDRDGDAVPECEVLDFKEKIPETDAEYAKAMRDLVALHNSYGGFLVFGVKEVDKDREFQVLGVPNKPIDIMKLRSLTIGYLSAELRLTTFRGEVAGKLIEVIGVGKRSSGDAPVKFAKNGPELKPKALCFKRGEVVFRRLQSNAVAASAEDFEFLNSPRRPSSIDLSPTDTKTEDPIEHNLPDRSSICAKFVGRREDLGDLWTWLTDEFSRVRLIAGEGGLGKTSLAYRFAEEVATRRIKPFEKVVWLTAKKKQFVASRDTYRDTTRTDFYDAKSLLEAVVLTHGGLDSDFEGLGMRELQALAIDVCEKVPSFVVIDDVDSLSRDDQQRALELGLKAPPGSKMLLTTRVNVAYSPDNILKLNGLQGGEFHSYVRQLRSWYRLADIKDSKIDHVHEISGGSPLFTDSIFRLERHHTSLDQAIKQWRGQKGLEARKAALRHEVEQLSRESKRVLFVISHVRSASFVELSQILDYAEQTLDDALQELAGLFLVKAPPLARQPRYTVETNTGLLVLELANSLDIDHAALVEAVKRARSDAIGQSIQKSSDIVGQAIFQAMAMLRDGDVKGALNAVQSTSKKVSKPHPDLLLAEGRFSMRLDPPNRDQASKAFGESYRLGQRKRLLFDLWFECEFQRKDFDSAINVATKAITHDIGDISRWYERRAQVHIVLAKRSNTRASSDTAIRELEAANSDLKEAKNLCGGEIQEAGLNTMLKQTQVLLEQVVSVRRK